MECFMLFSKSAQLMNYATLPSETTATERIKQTESCSNDNQANRNSLLKRFIGKTFAFFQKSTKAT